MRVRTPGDGPKCSCGRPAVWSGFCEMEDGKGWCSNTKTQGADATGTGLPRGAGAGHECGVVLMPETAEPKSGAVLDGVPISSPVASALRDDMGAAYEALASWQVEHRRQFPRHLTEATLLVRCDDDLGAAQFTVKLLADIDDGLINKPPRLFAEAHGRTAKAAAESAITGADTNVSECARHWSRKLVRSETINGGVTVHEYSDQTIDLECAGQRVTLEAHWGPAGDEGSMLHVSRDDRDVNGNKVPRWVDEELVSAVEQASMRWEAV